jgi:hypothetical protein
VIDELTTGIRRAGSLRAYAKQLGVSAAYLSDVVNEKRQPGIAILRPLGMAKVTESTTRYYRVSQFPSPARSEP